MSTPADQDLGIPGLEDAVEIARGGFATIYRARQPAFRRDVAVKVLHAQHLTDEGRLRFERECEAMGSLSAHPGIATLFDAGFTTDSRPYLVMEYRPTGSLADRLERGAPLDWEQATAVAVQIAGALESAHRAGVLHRDVKPANILVSGFGDAELTDFGIAVLDDKRDTRSGELLASLVHAAPELLDGERPSPASDVYSLGSTLFELLSGQSAFGPSPDEMAVATVRRVADDPVPDLREQGVPDEVCAVVEQSMRKDPAERPLSAAALATELNRAREANGAAPVPVRVGEAGDDATRHVAVSELHARSVLGGDGPDTSGPPVSAPRHRRRRNVAIAATVGVVALAAAALGTAATRDSAPTVAADLADAPDPTTDDAESAATSAPDDAAADPEADAPEPDQDTDAAPAAEADADDGTANDGTANDGTANDGTANDGGGGNGNGAVNAGGGDGAPPPPPNGNGGGGPGGGGPGGGGPGGDGPGGGGPGGGGPGGDGPGGGGNGNDNGGNAATNA